mgnify:CR=1 FL=1
MLILSLNRGNRVLIGGEEIILEVVEIRGSSVRIGITADRSIPVHSAENVERAQAAPQQEGRARE